MHILPWHSAWVIPVLRSRLGRLCCCGAGRGPGPAFIGVVYAAPVLIGGGFATYAEKVLPLALPVALDILGLVGLAGSPRPPDRRVPPGRSEIVPIRVPVAPR